MKKKLCLVLAFITAAPMYAISSNQESFEEYTGLHRYRKFITIYTCEQSDYPDYEEIRSRVDPSKLRELLKSDGCFEGACRTIDLNAKDRFGSSALLNCIRTSYSYGEPVGDLFKERELMNAKDRDCAQVLIEAGSDRRGALAAAQLIHRQDLIAALEEKAEL